ncbi:alpha/beta hydrolase [Parathalassolituus penaei]|uniref:Alpha/beta hydrolase n=1 Tax=Parathalassolituus penaei TaxID=2997323 RepID=A0A9X3EJ52_9GAMM|nr:alpha/beta hydrolase [Parathalassolituus penaei]MCY0965206.1 alpha/beta hydrolase [Parathalassolituus penaei]
MPTLNSRRWSAVSLRAALTEFDWSLKASDFADLAAYRQFYGLPEAVCGAHQAGWSELGGYRLYTQFWAAQNPRGSVLVVHGYYDHSGLYGPLIRRCLQLGLNVLTFDLPGHGLSDGAQATIGSFDEYVAITAQLFRQAQTQLPGHWLAIGQSTGGAILASWLLHARLQAGVDAPLAMLLLAPLLRPAGWSHGRLLHRLLSPVLTRLKRQFSRGGNNPEFSRFLAEDDPLQSHYLSVAWVTAMKQWMGWVEQQSPLPFPLTLVQGDADQTVDFRYNLPVYQRLFPQIQIHNLSGGHHHLVNETAHRREQLWQWLQVWLDDNLPKSA